MSAITRVLPRRLISRLTGRLTRLRRPGWLIAMAQRLFIQFYQIDMNEAEYPLSAYPTLNALFTRRLCPGVRPTSQNAWVHCADARITQATTALEGKLLQAKGFRYAVSDLLGPLSNPAIEQQARAWVYYLCPTDYHRVHVPTDSSLLRVWHQPGDLWPVNQWSLQSIFPLFVRNERVVCELQTEQGEIYFLVFIAATNVGQVELKPLLEQQWHSSSLAAKVYELSAPLPLRKAEELGVFHMGSTVILLRPCDFSEWSALQIFSRSSAQVQVGQALDQSRSTSGP